jgi:hypothetical protein
MMFREINTTYSENWMKRISTLCGKKCTAFYVKTGGTKGNHCGLKCWRPVTTEPANGHNPEGLQRIHVSQNKSLRYILINMTNIWHILYSQLHLWVPSGSLSRCFPITSAHKSSFPTFQLHVQLIVAYQISLSKSISDDVDKAWSFSLRTNLKYPFTSYVVGLNIFQDRSKTWYISSVYASYTVPSKGLCLIAQSV